MPRQTSVACIDRLSHVEGMNGFIIETTHPNPRVMGGQEVTHWIGIKRSVLQMIEAVPGRKPSVVDRGPEVLQRALEMGLKPNEVRQLPSSLT